MLRIVAAVAALAVGATFAYAQNLDVIKQRKDSMKAVGGAAGAVGKMMKGEAPFDLATVQKSLATYATEAGKQKAFFTDDSKTGGETTALPKIWEARADFNAKMDKFAADATATAAAIKDEASMKTEWPKVMGNCGGCHKEYRTPPKQ
jgi:cytochrome c556